ncbi:xanthine dehydrogenase/oxidase-like [Saccoglossus kowalevskii]
MFELFTLTYPQEYYLMQLLHELSKRYRRLCVWIFEQNLGIMGSMSIACLLLLGVVGISVYLEHAKNKGLVEGSIISRKDCTIKGSVKKQRQMLDTDPTMDSNVDFYVHEVAVDRRKREAMSYASTEGPISHLSGVGLLSITNVYSIPHVRVRGFTCKTNLPSNTAMRGFGRSQAMMVAEYVINQVAIKCGLPAEKVRQINLLKEGELTIYGQVMENWKMQQCWDECIKVSDLHNRKTNVALFNKNHQWTKRGISIVPTKLGIGFGCKFLSQAGALVNVYLDGSVLLTHGGIEMGQGIHTKMIQIASTVLGVPVERVYIAETSTHTVPNTSPTAASTGTDLNGMAVMNACKKIKNRLQPFMENNPEGPWEKWIEGAFLQGYGLFMTEELHWSDKGQLLSTGPGTYNVPRVQDIPREFNIHLMPNSDNPKAVFSSKGVGEPPLVLAASVFFAVKEAIRSVRMNTKGDSTDFQLDTPATAQRIRMACGDCFELSS